MVHPEKSRLREGFLLLAAWMLVSCPVTPVSAAEPNGKSVTSNRESVEERLDERRTTEILGVHVGWDDGLRVVGSFEEVQLRVGGAVMLEGGTVSADRDLNTAIGALEGDEVLLRRLRLNLSGILGRNIEFKTDFDFANVREIKDQWIRFPGVPVLERFRFGHQKEPLSLEEQTSSNHITFMETALPTEAFAPGRNFGIRYDHAAPDLRTTWAAGIFWATSSYGDTSEVKDSLTNREGVNLTARLTRLVRYEDHGKDLLHLGLGFSHQFRDAGGDAPGLRMSSHPESRLTTQKLVGTGPFAADERDLISGELAWVVGALSFQSECFFAFTQAEKDHQFWGFYLYGSWFLTGESRRYSRSRAVFTGVDTIPGFRPLSGEWGALELGLRYSFLDLNDGEIRGGRERNLTAGVNWYLYPEIRVMANYVRAIVEDRADPSMDAGRADIWTVRLQLAF